MTTHHTPAAKAVDYPSECSRLIRERDEAWSDLRDYRDASRAESAELRAERLQLLAERDALREQVAALAGTLASLAGRVECYSQWASDDVIRGRGNDTLREIARDARDNAKEARAVLARVRP